jgi:fermentation-respiration switch protein FrsA (DUF1100 family)/alkylhydroperoxidase/carboxymuconolactone decarboxylase family protein YurZ
MTVHAKDNDESALNAKERQIAVICRYAVRGDMPNLKDALSAGLEAGLTVNEIREVLVQLYAYCGFPRSIGALGSFMAVLQEREAQGIKDTEGSLPGPLPTENSVEFGAANQRKLFGRDAQGAVLAFAPAIDRYLKAHLFGDIFGRDNLDWKTRELATIAALAAMDGVENELKAHIGHGKYNGLTDAQIAEILAIAGNQAVNVPEPPKTFAAAESVTVQKIHYKNRYDITIAGDLYMPVNLDMTKKHAAIIVGHPFGGVKEQCAGLYAQEMAKRGFVALAFDFSYNGESGGMPRQTVSPEAFVEDFSASVDFIGTRPFVNRNRIGVIGICGSGGFSVSATAIDPRIKALATVSMYDMGRPTRQGLGDVLTDEQRRQTLVDIGEQRWKEFEGAESRIRFGTPEKLPENATDVQKEFFGYYRTERGYHPRYLGTRFTSNAALMNFFPFTQIKDISPRPALFVAGEKAHSRYFSEDAYRLAAEPRELYVVPGAKHVDLYDRMEYIPFDKLTDFFTNNMK